jgi:Pyruvate/2-oxoacid:ferredoxin oxidoreductase gamma subunit
MQIDPSKLVLVTDIGCIGLACRYFVTSAFHGLHGRSITYACGLKLARPDLTVIALKGDGGCGIGGTHLLNVARRNIGITLIVANNLNYGMTGGQHSVTTPTDGITSTTPWGNVEGPLDLCGTAAAAGAAWVYRTTMFDKKLANVLVRAIEQPGFAMCDVWELCTAYYSPQNEVKKSELFRLLERYGFEQGLLVDKPRPEYSVSYREAFAGAEKSIKPRAAIEKVYTSAVKKQTGIVIAGSAGQKIKSTATLFAKAAISSGLEVTQKDDYPITVMTGHSLAEIILRPERIDYTAIESPDYFILISEDGLRRARTRIEVLPETCLVFAEESLELPETKAQVVKIPMARTAKAMGKTTVGVVALAAMLARTGLFPTEALKTAISRFQKPEIAQANLKAFSTGIELVNL